MDNKNQGHFYPQVPQLPGETAPMGDGYHPHGMTQMQQPMPMQPQQVYVVQGQQHANFGPHPSNVTCPSCHETQMTNIKYESSTKTHLFATILCLTTCCCCIPYLIDTCKNANHYCAHCGAYLGTYNN